MLVAYCKSSLIAKMSIKLFYIKCLKISFTGNA